jgi:hypothetical protein
MTRVAVLRRHVGHAQPGQIEPTLSALTRLPPRPPREQADRHPCNCWLRTAVWTNGIGRRQKVCNSTLEFISLIPASVIDRDHPTIQIPKGDRAQNR